MYDIEYVIVLYYCYILTLIRTNSLDTVIEKQYFECKKILCIWLYDRILMPQVCNIVLSLILIIEISIITYLLLDKYSLKQKLQK